MNENQTAETIIKAESGWRAVIMYWDGNESVQYVIAWHIRTDEEPGVSPITPAGIREREEGVVEVGAFHVDEGDGARIRRELALSVRDGWLYRLGRDEPLRPWERECLARFNQRHPDWAVEYTQADA